jgi:hypothetical protein
MLSTGISGLDRILTGLKLGDNVVWQIDHIEDYVDVTGPFIRQARTEGRKIIYIRFAQHDEILAPSDAVTRYQLDAMEGFEPFTAKIHEIITREGEEAYYVFDCLSELLSAWASDVMIANFFMVTCPYLYDLRTIAYFSILRNHHSFKAIARIRETTQLLLDIYHCDEAHYVHPLKVWDRYSPTMFLPHRKDGDQLSPVTDSVNAAALLSRIRDASADTAKRNLDYWDRLFLDAEEALQSAASPQEIQQISARLCRIMIASQEKALALAESCFSLEDLIEIKSRMVGTGFIGGKSAGFLMARKILSRDPVLNWAQRGEAHDSFFIGSDIFYSFIVRNHLWKLRMRQKTPEGFFDAAALLRERMSDGIFSDDIIEQFQQIIEYFGASPIIIRSSSLLEDSFGNAFAGKYESVFLANQGSPQERYAQFINAVKTIYQSTMNEDALTYRKQRGLDECDEQMALLVQRVSGAHHQQYFFPDLAGVGVSHNAYVWNETIDPQDGMLRLVFGLGTRAVNRVEGDYPRIVALSDPAQRPVSQKEDLRKFSQHDVDLIDTRENCVNVLPFTHLVQEGIYADTRGLSVRDEEAVQSMKERGISGREYRLLTLDALFEGPDFARTFKDILAALQKYYQYPVEIEFTVNFTPEPGIGQFKVNLLQCRPLQSGGHSGRVAVPDNVEPGRILFRSHGYFLGGSLSQPIHRVIYVDPQEYHHLDLSDKYETARIIGRLNRSGASREALPVLLMGPGRWGTTTPSLGVPVSFSEINNIAVLVELAVVTGNFMPELSYGTHFFQDLVETQIFYAGLFPEKMEVMFNPAWLEASPDCFSTLLPESEKFSRVVRVYDVAPTGLKVLSDQISQKLICYADKPQDNH